MNIFYLDNHVSRCAEMHNDKHCIKMILEYAQLLSTAHRVIDGVVNVGLSASGRKKQSYVLPDYRDSVLYSATHINHPSAIWVRQSLSNYMWLSHLLVELCHEYTYRYGKVHKCESIGLVKMLLNQVPKNIPNGTFTEPTPAMLPIMIPAAAIFCNQSFKPSSNSVSSNLDLSLSISNWKSSDWANSCQSLY